MKDILPLQALIDDKTLNASFIKAFESRIEKRIKEIGSFKGIVIRKAYAALQAVRPNYVTHILEVLSRDYIREYTPLHEIYRREQNLPAESIEPLRDFVSKHLPEAREIFWRIANSYAARHKSDPIGILYQKFRTTLEEHLPSVWHEITDILEAYTVIDAKHEK